MTRDELAHAVSLTLGDHTGDFNQDGIIDAITTEYGPLSQLASIDAIPSDDYWEIVRAYDASPVPDQEDIQD